MTAYGFLEEKEYICCHEVVKMKDPYFEMDKNECVTKHPKFEKYVLDKGYPHMRLGGVTLHDLFSGYLPPRDKATTRNYRYATHRHFTMVASK